jgi:hypothetical protein
MHFYEGMVSSQRHPGILFFLMHFYEGMVSSQRHPGILFFLFCKQVLKRVRNNADQAAPWLKNPVHLPECLFNFFRIVQRKSAEDKIKKIAFESCFSKLQTDIFIMLPEHGAGHTGFGRRFDDD